MAAILSWPQCVKSPESENQFGMRMFNNGDYKNKDRTVITSVTAGHNFLEFWRHYLIYLFPYVPLKKYRHAVILVPKEQNI